MCMESEISSDPEPEPSGSGCTIIGVTKAVSCWMYWTCVQTNNMVPGPRVVRHCVRLPNTTQSPGERELTLDRRSNHQRESVMKEDAGRIMTRHRQRVNTNILQEQGVYQVTYGYMYICSGIQHQSTGYRAAAGSHSSNGTTAPKRDGDGRIGG